MENKKLRLLYAGTHPTLRNTDIRSLLSAGFEVVPSFVHIQFSGQYRINPKPLDNPFTEINKEWKRSCTLSSLDLLQAQMINLYKVSDEPFTKTNNPEHRVQSRYFSESGNLNATDEDFINSHFDVIVVQSFPNVAAALLSWFKGIVVFRIFGNETENFSVWDWYQNSLYNKNSMNFFAYRDKYLSLSVFNGLIETEKIEILGNHPLVLNSVNFDDIKLLTCKHSWQKTHSLPQVTTNISYLDISSSWQKYYEEFSDAFKNIPFLVYGKNDKSGYYCKRDPKIQAQIDDYEEYLDNYCQCRVFCNVGKLKQHSQYTPFECAAMGIPVLFLSSSAITDESLKLIPKDHLYSLGMCDNFTEMAKRAQKCLDEVEYAIELAQKQNDFFNFVFGEKRSFNQATTFYLTCENKLQKLNSASDKTAKDINTPSVGREKRILWAFYHKVNRYEEIPRWIEAGYEVIPIRMPHVWVKYQGFSYDDENDPMYPNWKSSCTLSETLIDAIRSIQLIKDDPKYYGSISRSEIELLNNHIGYIYIPASVPMALNLLTAGYKGIILNRYFGYYKINQSLTSISKYYPYNGLRLFPNYIWLPAMSRLSELESSAIAKPRKTVLVPYLNRNLDFFKDLKWSREKSKPQIATAISSISYELMHYYSNFLFFFGHLPYNIFGKNFKEDLQNIGIKDDDIIGSLPSEIDLYKKMCEMRVYVECGMTFHHSHYTPLEAITMGVPTLFWHKSGIGTELQTKFSSSDLCKMGMCMSWEEMALQAENCLSNADYAISLSETQRKLVNFVSPSEIIQSMRKVHKYHSSISLQLKFINFLPFSLTLRRLLINVLWGLNFCIEHFDKLDQKIRTLFFITKKILVLVFIFLGFKEDTYQLRPRAWKAIKKVLINL